jgi:hypothetical protein
MQICDQGMENAQTQEEAGVLHEKYKEKGSICSIERT